MRHPNRFFLALAAVTGFNMLAVAPSIAAKMPSVPAQPKPAAIVDVVQYPAWLDRDGRARPLAVGMELRHGDVIRTGEGARAYVTLAEGSRVKLAESARLTLHSRSLKPAVNFRGALDLANGAFRVTTKLLSKYKKRELTLRVGTATIGIRGTDLWGKAEPAADFVALLEGRIDVTRAGQTDTLTPMTFISAPRGQASEVRALDPAAFPQMARQTEIMAGDGAANSKGKWRVLAGVVDSEDLAFELYDQLNEQGFAARIRPVAGLQEPGWPWWNYEVQLLGFPTEADAKLAAMRLKAKTGIDAKGIMKVGKR